MCDRIAVIASSQAPWRASRKRQRSTSKRQASKQRLISSALSGLRLPYHKPFPAKHTASDSFVGYLCESDVLPNPGLEGDRGQGHLQAERRTNLPYMMTHTLHPHPSAQALSANAVRKVSLLLQEDRQSNGFGGLHFRLQSAIPCVQATSQRYYHDRTCFTVTGSHFTTISEPPLHNRSQ